MLLIPRGSCTSFNCSPRVSFLFDIIYEFICLFSAKEYGEIRERFAKHREELPPLFIATPYDKEASIWTRDHLTSKVVFDCRPWVIRWTS